ncbi:PPT1, partial [Symbiodinium sp. CCMP2456]
SEDDRQRLRQAGTCRSCFRRGPGGHCGLAGSRGGVLHPRGEGPGAGRERHRVGPGPRPGVPPHGLRI